MGPWCATPLVVGSIHIGPVQFDTPVWLGLIPIMWALVLLIGRRSISGLGGASKWTALAVRFIVIAMLAGAMAEPQWRRESKDVSVTFVLDASKSVPSTLQAEVDKYVEDARAAQLKADPGREGRLGIVTAARESYVQTLPSKLARNVEKITIGSEDATNLSQGLRLAMAVLPEDAANRIVIASDGNETVGSLLQAAEVAKAAGVPIDVLPLSYKYDAEVIVDKLVAPATARRGENMMLRVLVTATKPTAGFLTVTMNGEAVDLDPDTPGQAARVELRQGPNVMSVPVRALTSGPQKFEAVFEPLREPGRPTGDQIVENNRAMAVTFVSGEGRVLVVGEAPEETQALAAALTEAKIEVEVVTAERMPADLTSMNRYEAIVLVNEPSYNFSIKQQEDLKQYVHDSGGGLVMVGGPESFGAGGWIGSPLEDALPVRLDPPQKRQMPRGALALVMHSVEIPQGVYYGKKVCEAAVNALSRLDLVGINEFNGMGSVWVHPLQVVGDGSLVKQRINNLQFGDMPDFAPSLKLAYDALVEADAGQKHVIMISDGDPQEPSKALLQRFVDAKISISCVGIGVHGVNEQQRMKGIADATAGRFYDVSNDLASLPQIFIKEAQTVRRSLIWEGTAFQPAMTGGATETMRGLGQVPAISGYVVAAEREGLALVTLRGKENDPIAAQWQFGLGKAVAFTSDATSRWAGSWVSWANFRQFWEQHLRWVMRPGGSANIRVTTENKGDETVITVDALDASGERVNFANFMGRLALPNGEGQDVSLRQIGPGRYEGRVRTDKPGAYVASFRYVAPGKDGGPPVQGSVQAAVTRPFADEYRALEDNTPLLKQIAEMTGGRVLSFDPAQDNVWDASGLKFPVATRPIWLTTAILAIGLFLVDVGVRRVRVDVPALARGVAGVFRRGKKSGVGEVGALKAAREKARAGITARSSGTISGNVAAGPQPPPDVARAKFEATPDQLRRPTDVALGGPEAMPERPKAFKADQQKKPGEPEEGMSALMKAKRRAREGMEEDKRDGGT
jgi:uncharacterized membrane protein/Mg-chelatase subunit ChlD